MFEHIKKGDEVRLTCGKVGSCQGATDKTIWLLVGMTMVAFNPKTGLEFGAAPMYRIDKNQYDGNEGTYAISAKDAYEQTEKFEVTEEVLEKFFTSFRKRQENVMSAGYTNMDYKLRKEKEDVIRFAEGAISSIAYVQNYTDLVERVADILRKLGYMVSVTAIDMYISWGEQK